MQFYKIEGLTANTIFSRDDTYEQKQQKTKEIASKSEIFNHKLNNKAFFFVSAIVEQKITIGFLIQEKFNYEKSIVSYLKSINLVLKNKIINEVKFSFFCKMLNYSSKNDFIDDTDIVLENFGLDRLIYDYSGGIDFNENIISINEKKFIYEDAKRFLLSDTFIPELNRIYANNKNVSAIGHPVHYIIETDDNETRKEASRLLIQALYSNKRLNNKRYCFIDFEPDDNFSITIYDLLYKCNIGGAIIVRYNADNDSENAYANSEREIIEKLCKIMKKYCNQVLTIFCLPRECAKSKEIFYENLLNISFVELKENFAYKERAEQFLKMIAKGKKVRTDKKLFSMLESDKGYLANDLHNIFDEWYNNKLKTSIYPQYKEITTTKCEIKKSTPKGSAYDELTKMIGLDSAKKVIHQALDYYKAQKLFADKGMNADHPTMHMIFTGNPGTAKTTVARLFTRIMKENNLISKGNLIEVGRGDLIGKFIGWTAPTIQKKFKEAQGGVLFIDEAYSLVDDNSGSFGDEAINTIVQEMENHRDDVVVIFAGYPNEMNKFLQKNPGLRSRIAFHVQFADYSTNGLCEIANLIASKKGLHITDQANKKLACIFEKAKNNIDFGNGRYVRNVIETAKMAQATRLINKDFDSITTNDITTLCAEDIEMPILKKESKRQIGFIA